MNKVLVVNGIPVFAFELKNQYTGQNVDNAKTQWMYDRDPRERCFQFNKRILAYFCVEYTEVWMTTRLTGVETFRDTTRHKIDGKVKFLLDASVPVKNSLPSEEERRKRDEMLAEQEEGVCFSDLIELVNEYDYSEEDLLKIENQVMITFKYLEILSKTLPAFCQNMKVDQQDILVSLIYRCPNKFLFKILMI